MSFDATRQVWAMRRAQQLPGGTPHHVLCALADEADRQSGEVRASARYLADLIGVHHSQVTRALAVGRAAGLIELVLPGEGTRPALYRFPRARLSSNTADAEDTAAARPSSTAIKEDTSSDARLDSNTSDPQKLSTARPGDNARGSLAVHSARPRSTTPRLRGTASASPQHQIPDQAYPTTQEPARARKTPAETALALMVVVETNLANANTNTRRPAAVAKTIERRLAGAYGARLAGMVAEGLSPERAAATALAEDGVGGLCPLEGCRATDAKPITDEARCPRRRSCPFFVGDHDPPEEVLL